MEQLLSDPAKVTATSMLVLAIIAFYKVLIVPRQTHDSVIAQLIASQKEAVIRMESDLKREREDNEKLRLALERNTDVVDKALDSLEKALQAVEKSHQFRGEVFGQGRTEGA